MRKKIGLLGCGYSVPTHVRYNDDPIFRDMRYEPNSQGIVERDLFTGNRERRYLHSTERIETLMIEASRQALAHAHLQPDMVDRLYGYATVSPYLTPNALYEIHRELGLPQHALVTPINNEFSTFLTGIIHAYEAIAAGHSRYALVVCGTNWSKHMDYSQGHSFSIGDGAGAAVVGVHDAFSFVDYTVQTRSEQYGAMTMHIHPTLLHGHSQIPVDEQDGMPIPTYTIQPEEGIQSFQQAMPGPAEMIKKLLKKHGLHGDDIALITHQGSRLLLDYWKKELQPNEYLETMEQFGNMTLATYPVNLAYYQDKITSKYILLIAVGVGYHQVALLLKRKRLTPFART